MENILKKEKALELKEVLRDPEEFNKFKEEMAQIIQNEREKRETAHFERVKNPRVDELTEDDMHIWEKIKANAVTMEEFAEYRESLNELLKDTEEWGTRKGFLSLAANRATSVIIRNSAKNNK